MGSLSSRDVAYLPVDGVGVMQQHGAGDSQDA